MPRISVPEHTVQNHLDHKTNPNSEYTGWKYPAGLTPSRKINPDGRMEVVSQAELPKSAFTQANLPHEDVIRVLVDAGVDPEAWEVERYSPNRWQAWSKDTGPVQLESHRLTLIPSAKQRLGKTLDEIFEVFKGYRPTKPPTGNSAYLIATGDWQISKTDGDGLEGTLKRFYEGIYLAAEDIKSIRKQGQSIGSIGFFCLGDEIEGFVSQSGANAWRTGLSLTEQIRLTRRMKLEAIKILAPLTRDLLVSAVPGNHDETVRDKGKQITKANDSYTIDTTLAIAESLQMYDEDRAVPRFAHVRFVVPDEDRLTTTVELANTRITSAHGHQWKRGGHFAWLNSMTGNRQQAGGADVLLAGHHHSLSIQEEGPKFFVQTPSLESESTWWLNKTGQIGHPGMVGLVVSDGVVDSYKMLRQSGFKRAA